MKKYNIKNKLQNILNEAENQYKSIVNNTVDNSSNNNLTSDSIEKTEEQNNEKTKLTKIAAEKIKQSLDVTDELQSILNQINKLNKENNYNRWTANEEDNTATLDNKNAYIFKQNNNLCLSHNGKIEIFKSVEELHDWLKENNYPLPKNIKLHETSKEINKQSNYAGIALSDLQKSKDWYIKKFGEVVGNMMYKRNSEKAAELLKLTPKPSTPEELEKYNNKFAVTYHKMGKDAEKRVREFMTKDELNAIETRKLEDYLKKKAPEKLIGYLIVNPLGDNKYSYVREHWMRKDTPVLTDNINDAMIFNKKNDAMVTSLILKRRYDIDNNLEIVARSDIYSNMKECFGGGTTTSTLSTPVQYVGNKKESYNFKDTLKALLNKKSKDVALTEDDTPEDFATDIDMSTPTNNTPDNVNILNNTDIPDDTDINSLDDTTDNKDIGFGDININTGNGEYAPEGNEEEMSIPTEPQDEYKIIDVLVNDFDETDIKVKVKNLTTNEIEIKDLNEIDI